MDGSYLSLLSLSSRRRKQEVGTDKGDMTGAGLAGEAAMPSEDSSNVLEPGTEQCHWMLAEKHQGHYGKEQLLVCRAQIERMQEDSTVLG